jgi:hypothetical protein
MLDTWVPGREKTVFQDTERCEGGMVWRAKREEERGKRNRRGKGKKVKGKGVKG